MFGIVLYSIVSLNSTPHSAHQSEALPVRETQGKESIFERMNREVLDSPANEEERANLTC